MGLYMHYSLAVPKSYTIHVHVGLATSETRLRVYRPCQDNTQSLCRESRNRHTEVGLADCVLCICYLPQAKKKKKSTIQVQYNRCVVLFRTIIQFY